MCTNFKLFYWKMYMVHQYIYHVFLLCRNSKEYLFYEVKLCLFSYTVSPKRKYTLLPSRVLKTEGWQMKSRGCPKRTIELVQNGPSLILKFKEMAAYQQKPWGDPLLIKRSQNCKIPIDFHATQWWMWRTPYFSSSPPRFWVLGFATSVYFLLVETVSLVLYQWGCRFGGSMEVWTYMMYLCSSRTTSCHMGGEYGEIQPI